ncbi:MAG: succinylglutamate desuccinylase/aspartoacylase family protein, partial [Proteobacteria bacterium]|nr:succinylglutamate desuccinylase/aspartoacylase family protein [Pseudomonadota bacterium]
MIKNTNFAKINTVIRVMVMTLVVVLPGLAQAQKRIHTAFYEGTDYELNVYRIYGKEPGKTLLLIGGIQGDEPGGYLSVDHYADISLAKGNLIVVPRANFQSIVLNRRKINDDMNRKFADDSPSNYEAKIVKILKKLIVESDCLLNLHDGSGFFSEKWEGSDRNPGRHG